MIVIDSPADDRALLTLAEIKAAVGETTSDNDAALTSLAVSISDVISNLCGVQTDGVNPPTLLSEDIVETVRLSQASASIALSRRYVTAIDSILVDDEEIDDEDYELNPASGVLKYLDTSGTCYVAWPAGKTVVTYTAGFATTPEPLKLAAKALARETWTAEGRDPLLRGEMHEGLGSMQYFQSSLSSSSGISQAVLDILAPYRQVVA